MTAVLDKPTVDPVVLDETILDDDPACQSATGCERSAEWSCVMRCCGHAASLCSPCTDTAKRVAEGYYITCRQCGHVHGYVPFHKIVAVNPI